MFEPACRGGSKRSLNISNPTPKWPRSPGEMVSAPDRAADTHTRTHALALTLTRTRTHAHAADPCAHRPAAAPPLRSESPFRLRDFFFLFIIFNLPLLGFPPCNGESKHFSRQDLSGELLGPPVGRREGTPALLLRPGFSGERSPEPAKLRQGPGSRRGAGAGRGRRPLPALGSTRFPARARGPGLASAALALLPEGRKFTLCSGLNSERGGSSLRRAPPPPNARTPPGPAPRNGVPLGVRSCKKMGTCVGAPVPDTPGWRPEWRVLFAAGCSPD